MSEMSASLTELGIDEESFSWRDLILCKGMAVNLNKQQGVRGGIYLSNGKPDTLKNRHKTPDIWKQLKDRISGQDIL